MAERPGILFYFDILDVLEDFTNAEVGQLFLATMRYGITGEVAEFEDRGMRSVWRQLMQFADRDQVQFDKKILQRRYAGWKSAQLKKGVNEEDLPSFEQWQANLSLSKSVNDRQRPLTTVESRSISFNEINQLQPQLQLQLHQSTSTINNQQSSIRNQMTEEIEGYGEEEEQPYRSVSKVPSRAEDQLSLPSDVRQLLDAWNTAMDAGDRNSAFSLSNDLFRAGYNVDVSTRQLSKK